MCILAARPEENGVEVAPVDRGSDRGRRVKGSRGRLNESPEPSVLTAQWCGVEFMLTLCRFWRSRSRQGIGGEQVLSSRHGVGLKWQLKVAIRCSPKPIIKIFFKHISSSYRSKNVFS